MDDSNDMNPESDNNIMYTETVQCAPLLVLYVW